MSWAVITTEENRTSIPEATVSEVIQKLEWGSQESVLRAERCTTGPSSSKTKHAKILEVSTKGSIDENILRSEVQN